MRRNQPPLEPEYEEREPTRRYQPPVAPELPDGEAEAPYQLMEDDPADGYADEQLYDEPPYDAAPYEGAPYDGDMPYDEDEFYDEGEYSDYHEALDDAHRLRVAMNVFDVVSVLIGCVCIFVLVTLLISLFNWLIADVTHGLNLFGSTLQ